MSNIPSGAHPDEPGYEGSFEQWCDEVKAEAKRKGVGYLFPDDISFLKEYYDFGETPKEHVSEQINAGL